MYFEGQIFLNAIDKVDAIKEKYQKNIQELKQNIPMLQRIVLKPFEKEQELVQLKDDVSKLKREISINIQKNRMAHEADKDSAKEELK